MGYVEVSQGCHTMKRSCSKSPSSQPLRRSCKNLYLSQFTFFIHDYIEDIIDVEPYGNYGFNDIATLLGWGEDSWSLVRIPRCSKTRSLKLGIRCDYIT